jgi:excisionase family DNA binding protein
MYIDDIMELLTVQETAEILRVAPITVRRFIAAGRLTAVRAGRGVRVRRESVDELIQPVETSGSAQPTEKPKAGALKGRPLTFDDPLWELVGSATDAEPTDASRKYEYLAEAPTPRRS